MNTHRLHSIDAPSRKDFPAFLATLWLACFVVFAPVVDGAITFFPSLLIVTALLFGWSNIHRAWRSLRMVFIGWFLFVGGAVLSLVNNSDWGFAGWRFEKYWPFLFLPLVINLLGRLKRPHWLAIGAALVAGSVTVAAVGAYHLVVLGEPRLGLVDSLNPNRVSELAFLYTLMLLAGLIMLPNRWTLRMALTIALLAAFYAGVVGGSRAAFGAFTLAGLVLAAIWVVREGHWRNAILTVLLLILLAGIMSQTSDFSGRLAMTWDSFVAYRKDPTVPSSLGIRLNLWRAALRIAGEHPLLGTGIGDAMHDAQRLVDTGEIPLHKAFARFHSVYAGALATTGLVGLGTLLVGLFFVPAAHLWRQARKTGVTGLAAYGAWSGLTVLLYYLPLGLASSWLFNRGMPAFYVAMAVVFTLSHFQESATEATGRMSGPQPQARRAGQDQDYASESSSTSA